MGCGSSSLRGSTEKDSTAEIASQPTLGSRLKSIGKQPPLDEAETERVLCMNCAQLMEWGSRKENEAMMNKSLQGNAYAQVSGIQAGSFMFAGGAYGGGYRGVRKYA